MRDISSAYWLGLQDESLRIAELIRVDTRTKSVKYTTSNQTIVSSGFDYEPFPGSIPKGPQETTAKGINNIQFILSNSGGFWDDVLDTKDFDFADVEVVRVFVDSPDLDAMHVFKGKMGEYSYDRNQVTGQVRDRMGAGGIQFPYYNFADQCQWRFGGPGCGVETDSLTLSGSLDASTDKLTITVASGFISGSGYLPDAFRFGRATIQSGQNSGYLRSIRTQTGDILGLSHPLPFNVDSGDLIDIFRGCKKTLITDCTSTFDNNSNWLGFAWIPEQGTAF